MRIPLALGLAMTLLVTGCMDEEPHTEQQLLLLQLATEQQPARLLHKITAPGYLNQPVFSHDGQWLYFTKQTGEGALATDIYQVKVPQIMASGAAELSATPPATISPLLSSATGEFSATPHPTSPDLLTVVVVEPDGLQRLWSIQTSVDTARGAMSGQLSQAPLWPELRDVGYHVLGTHGDVLVFQLENKLEPHRAVYQNAQGEQRVILRDIGRSLLRHPKTGHFYVTAPLQGQFLTVASSATLGTSVANSSTVENAMWLWQFDPAQSHAEPVIALPTNTESLSFSPDGDLLASQQQQLWRYDAAQWQPWLDLAAFCDGKITRFQFDPSQQLLAFVCQTEAS